MKNHMKTIRVCVFFCAVILMLVLSSCSGEATPDPNAIKPSKPGETGEALELKGDLAAGETIFKNKCEECHGEEGKGGILNSGSEAGTIPALNPIEATLFNKSDKVFAANIDLFIEHGSVPKGKPARTMMAYGDYGLLEPQEIADVIAYIISLNTK
jgi:cytochrome c2